MAWCISSSRRTFPVVFDQTRAPPTHYSVDVMGGGLNPAVMRRISAKTFLGMATSAIWNAS